MRILPAVLSSIAILTVSIGSSYAANSMSVGIRNTVKDDNGRTYSVSRTSERWCGSGQTCDAPSSISFGRSGTATNRGTGYDRRMIYTYQVNDYGVLPRVCRINVTMTEVTSSTCKNGSSYVTGFCSGSISTNDRDCTATGSVAITYHSYH